MKIVEAIELQEVDIPIESILKEDGSFDIQEDVRKYFDIEYKPKSDKLRLVAGGRIGLIPVNDNLAVNVKPKFSIVNLIHIISKSGDEISTLDFFTREYSALSQSTSSLFVFFAKSLDKELRQISNEGVYREYGRTESNLSSPKGKIDFSKTMLRNWSRGNYSRVVVSYFEYTEDTELNRLIKFTLWFCLNQLCKDYKEESELITSLSYYYDVLHTVPVDINRNFIDAVDEILAYDKIPALRHYYINIARLCKLIVNDMSVSLSTQGNDVNLLSFCIDMASTFEKYILNVLKNNISNILPEALVLDGNDDGEKPLFEDRKKPEAKPDYVIRINNDNKLLIDSKYKPRLKENDRYQIIAHSLSYGVKKALLLSPCGNNHTSGLNYYGTIGRDYNLQIYEYHIDLGAENLEKEEAKFMQAINQLCNEEH